MEIKHPQYFGQLLHKGGFKTWFLYMFRVIEGRKFTVEDMHNGLFEEFQDIYEGKRTRENINVPPRSGKTTMAMYFLAYALAVNAKCNFIYTSFSQELLSGISSQLSGILQHPIYKAMYNNYSHEETFETSPLDEFWQEYLKESENKEKFTSRKIVTKEGGVILFASIGSTITGFGCGIRGSKEFSGALFIDDANKPADIRSQVKRTKVRTYYEETLLTRLNESHTPIVNIQQRLHMEDLSGILTKIYKFNTLKRPLLIDEVCQLPSQYTPERIQELQQNKYMFGAQYQQEPTIEGGNLFKLETIREVKAESLPAEYDFRFIVGDLSYKAKESNDYQCFTYWGVKNETLNNIQRPHLYLIDCKRKKLNSVDVEPWITPWIEQKITYGFRYIWIEDKSHGIYLNQSYRKKGLPIPSDQMLKETLPRDVDKVMRANNVIPCLDSLNPNMTFNTDIENYTDLLQELLAFDSGDHDDFVDNVIDGIKIGLFKKKVTSLDVL